MTSPDVLMDFPFAASFFAAAGSSPFTLPEAQRQNPARDSWIRFYRGAWMVSVSWNGPEGIQVQHYKTGVSGWDTVAEVAPGHDGLPRPSTPVYVTTAYGFLDIRVRSAAADLISDSTVAKKRVAILNFIPMESFDGDQLL